ncbi:hypothetical protein PSN_5120 [Pseudomonas sp. NGC7]
MPRLWPKLTQRVAVGQFRCNQVQPDFLTEKVQLVRRTFLHLIKGCFWGNLV